MISLLVFLIVFGVLITVHEFGHFIAAGKTGVRVEKFSLGFGPRLFRKKKCATEYCISAIPLGGYVKLAGDNLEEYKGKPDEYLSKTPGERSLIIFCGPLFNYILGFFCFWLIFYAGYPALTTKVGGLLDGYGAKDAGIKVGDKVVAIDGRGVNSWDDLQMAIFSKESSDVAELLVLRENKEYPLQVRLKKKQLDDRLGAKREVGLLGITPDFSETTKVRYGFGRSFILGAKKTWDLTAMTYKALWRMIGGRLSLRESVSGPLGIFYITSQAARLGITAVLNLFGLLSISLAIFNLLPLPVLDGGHLLLLALEKIRGKYLSIKTERLLTQIGMTIIICLALFVTYNDVLRIFKK